jgi:DNA-binding protein H-NS
VEYQNLSAEEIQQQIEQAKQREAELKRALDQRRQAEKTELAQHIRQMITDRGYDAEEVINLMLPRSKRRGSGGNKRGSGGGSGNYTRYVDPDNPENVYTRGVLPGWMKEKMQSLGLDHKNREHRETFKSNHLTAMAD